MSSSDWPEMRLGDLVNIRHGWPFKSEYFSAELTGQPIVVSIGNFEYTGGFRFDATTVKEYRGCYPPEYELAPGETPLVMTCQTAGGEILGVPATIPDDGRVYLHNQRMGRVNNRHPDQVDSKYLYWLFLLPAFNRELVTTASGSKILRTSPSRIEDFRFRLPPVEVQKRIAGALDAIQGKIELNRRMNRTLESTARYIFQAWFVDSDRPRSTGNSGKATASDWPLVPFADTVEILSGGTPRTAEPNYWDGDVLWYSVADAPSPGDVFVVRTEKTISADGVENSAAQVVPSLTTIISARGTVGKCALTAQPMAFNQSCFGLRPADGNGVRYTYFSTLQVVDQLRRSAHGSVFSTITRPTFDAAVVPLPPSGLVSEFEELVRPLMARILRNVRESETLRQARDTLLPQLLSGRLVFGEADDSMLPSIRQATIYSP